MSSFGLAIIAGSLGAIVAIWGVVAPPSGIRHKIAFILAGGIGVLALITSSILNASSQTDLLQQVGGLRSDIQNLAKLTAVSPSASTDQILASVAAKLIELQPRHLTADQSAKMTAVASQYCSQMGKIPVTAANGNQEAQALAVDIIKVFNAAGCNAHLVLNIPGIGTDLQGIRVGMRVSSSMPMEVEAIGKVLSAGGEEFQYNLIDQDFFPGEPFVLVVGAKSE